MASSICSAIRDYFTREVWIHRRTTVRLVYPHGMHSSGLIITLTDIGTGRSTLTPQAGKHALVLVLLSPRSHVTHNQYCQCPRFRRDVRLWWKRRLHRRLGRTFRQHDQSPRHWRWLHHRRAIQRSYPPHRPRHIRHRPLSRPRDQRQRQLHDDWCVGEQRAGSDNVRGLQIGRRRHIQSRSGC